MDNARFHFDKIIYLNCEDVLLYQIGDLSCGYEYTVSWHKQICYEYSLILSGKADFYIGDEKYVVKPGDLILNLPGEMHKIQSHDYDPVRYLYFGFGFYDKDPEEYPIIEMKKYLDNSKNRIVTDTFNLKELFFATFNEMNADSSFKNLMISKYVSEILIKCFRNFFDVKENIKYAPKISNMKADDMVYSIINLLDSADMKIDKLSSIGEKYGYSYAYLSQIFTKKVGMSISEYFYNRLFERAVNMLLNGMSVTEVANELGYNSIHTFSRAFSRHYGISPSKYQS